MSQIEIKKAAPCRLEPHPLLAAMPMQQDVITRVKANENADQKKREMRREAEADWAAFVADIAENGVREPIRAVPHGEGWLIADGRHRLAALIETGAEIDDECVPIIEIAEAEALRVIESAVIARRHITKSARAWMAVCLHPDVATEGEARAKEGGTPRKEYGGYTQISLAAKWGVSLALIEKACTLFRRVENAPIQRKGVDTSIWLGSGLVEILNGKNGGDAQQGATGSVSIPFRTWRTGLERSFRSARKSIADWEPCDHEAAVQYLGAIKKEIDEIERDLEARIGGAA